jgi:hypothetical protein
LNEDIIAKSYKLDKMRRHCLAKNGRIFGVGWNKEYHVRNNVWKTLPVMIYAEVFSMTGTSKVYARSIQFEKFAHG